MTAAGIAFVARMTGTFVFQLQSGGGQGLQALPDFFCQGQG